MPKSWEPGPEIRRWQNRISRLLGEGLEQLGAWGQGANSVPVNIFETQHCLEAVFAMPALHKNDIEVAYEGDRLTVRGDKKHDVDSDRRYIHREWGYGPFFRTVTLPVPVDFDQATASYHNGVLTVILPKAQTVPSRRIDVASDEVRVSPASS